MNAHPARDATTSLPAAHFDATGFASPQAADPACEAAAPLGDASPSEWILIFATWFARDRPNLSAEDILARAISEFKLSHSLPPEQAAARCRG